jgi:nicotinate phosphoribosyltransferase
MVNNTQTMIREIVDKTNYLQFTDKYFIRSKEILEREGINPIVRYQIFARKNLNEIMSVDKTINFIKSIVGDKARIYALRDGMKYKAGEPIMKLEGNVNDLITLETVYLSILSGAATENINLSEARKNARAIKNTAQEKPVFYFGARHFAPELDEKIAKICQEENFAGCSTDIGAKAWNAKGIGTTPHALILTYAAYMQENNIKGNPTVEVIKGFDKYIDKNIPRIILIDYNNKEITDSIECAEELPNLKGIRTDTCGENYSERINEIILPNELNKIKNEINPKYFEGTGVNIKGVWALRQGLDNAEFPDLEITVSSGFNAEKTKAFMKADRIYQEIYNKPLFDAIGTGSLVKTTSFTSDICAYFSEKNNKWVPLSKVGRKEIPSNRLEERI